MSQCEIERNVAPHRHTDDGARGYTQTVGGPGDEVGHFGCAADGLDSLGPAETRQVNGDHLTLSAPRFEDLVPRNRRVIGTTAVEE